jgi:parvulin-like peptidyl-prolyl isomerase
MKILLTLIHIQLLFAAAFANAQPESYQAVAIVDTHTITLPQFKSRYLDYIALSGVNDTKPIRNSILNNMINEILLYYYDDNKNIFESDEYKKEFEWTKKQVILAFLKDREIYAEITASDDEVHEAFVKTNQKVAARHLFAATYEEANELYELVKAGVSFDRLAGQIFTDPVLRDNGGYIGYFSLGEMDPAFEETAFNLKIGEISKPVRTAHGYSIIKLEDKVTHPLLTESEFQKKRSFIERQLKIRKKIPFERAYLNSILNDDELIFNKPELEKLSVHFASSIILPTERQTEVKKNNYCVKYKSRVYLSPEIESLINELPAYHREKVNSKERLKTVIKGFILQDILMDIAHSKGYDSDPEVITTYDKMVTNIFLRYKRDEIANRIELSEDDLLRYYNDNIHFFTDEDEINIQEIIVDSRAKADSLMQEIESGKDFGGLAKDNSLREVTAKEEGIIGFEPKSRFGKLQEIFWSAEPGEVVGPLMAGDYYGIFKVIGKNKGKPKDFTLVKNNVEKALRLEMLSQKLPAYINDLHKKVHVEINEQLLHSFSMDEFLN